MFCLQMQPRRDDNRLSSRLDYPNINVQLAWLGAFSVPLLLLTGCRFLPRRLGSLDHLEAFQGRSIAR